MNTIWTNFKAWIWKVAGGTIPVVTADKLENDGSVKFLAGMYPDDEEVDDDTQE